MLRRSSLVLEICLSLVPLVFSQAPQDPIRDFCRRYGHQTALINRKLYIDGGYVNANPISQNPVAVISMRDHTDPMLQQSADMIPDEGLLYQDIGVIDNGMPELFDNLTKNRTIPDVAGGILWADEVNEIL